DSGRDRVETALERSPEFLAGQASARPPPSSAKKSSSPAGTTKMSARASAVKPCRLSRRTAYRYFPSAEQLAVEAALDATRRSMELSIDAGPADEPVVDRVER